MPKCILARVSVMNGSVTTETRVAVQLDVSEPAEVAKYYVDQGVDEILLNNVSASQTESDRFLKAVAKARAGLKVPLIVSGGIHSMDDISAIRDAGCDRVLISSVAVKNPGLVREASEAYGKHFVLVGMEPKRVQSGDEEVWEVHINGGRIPVGMEVLDWARTLQQLGAGQILLSFTSSERGETGFDIEMTRTVKDAVSLPVMVSGDPRDPEDVLTVLTRGGADGVLLDRDFSTQGKGALSRLRAAMSGP